MITGLIGALFAVIAPAAPAQAADLSSFDPGLIITDEIFFDGDALTEAQIQSFIVSKSKSCSGYTSGGTKYTCLKDYKADTAARAANAYCSAVSAKANETASSVIARVGRACGVNPQVLLVTLQKEQGLVTNAKSASAYRIAMGYGCPDTSACDKKYYGFFNQVYSAAWQFQRYTVGDFTYKPGRVNTIKYHPNSSCGTTQVYIRNQATAGLYNYTPYVPNQAALNAGYSTGNSCSSYGNRNFYNYFSDWFGNPANLLKSGGFESGSKHWGSGSNGSISIKLVSDSGVARSGKYYAVLSNGGHVGRWARQEVKVKGKNGAIYTGGVWVKSGTPGVPYQGVLRAGATGSGTTYVDVPFTANDSWQYVTARFAVNTAKYTKMRLNIQLNTAEGTLLVDDAALYPDISQPVRTALAIKNPSFEKSRTGWTHLGPDGTKSSIKKSSAAKVGKYYFGAKANKEGQSVRQRFAFSPQVGSSYTFGAWVMASDATKPYTGRLRLTTSGGVQEEAYTSFTVGKKWTYVTVTLDIKQPGHIALVPNIRLDTPGYYLRVDGTSLTPNLIQGGSFEGTAEEVFAGTGDLTPTWSVVDGSEYDVTPLDGDSMLLVTRTEGDGTPGSIALDDPRSLAVNEEFTATVWLRSAVPGETVTGRVSLWGRGGPVTNAWTEQEFTVGDEWQEVTVKHTPTGNRTWLRFELALDSGTAVLVDRLAVR